MAYAFKTLGDGVLAALVGLTKQAIHKSRKKGVLIKTLRRRVSRRLLAVGLEQTLAESYKVLKDDVYFTHRVMDHEGASQELADILGVPWIPTSSLCSVWRAFVRKCHRELPRFRERRKPQRT